MAQDFVRECASPVLAGVNDQQIGLSEQQPFERQRSIVVDVPFHGQIAQPSTHQQVIYQRPLSDQAVRLIDRGDSGRATWWHTVKLSKSGCDVGD